MKSKSHLLELITRLRHDAASSKEAYTQRIRLKRAILSTARLACKQHGIPVPDRIEEVKRFKAEDGDKRLLATCRKLAIQSDELCQPSEAFGPRWQEEWGEVVELLTTLEDQLHDKVTTSPGLEELG